MTDLSTNAPTMLARTLREEASGGEAVFSRTGYRNDTKKRLHGATPARVRILIRRWITTCLEVRGWRARVSQRSSPVSRKRRNHWFRRFYADARGEPPPPGTAGSLPENRWIGYTPSRQFWGRQPSSLAISTPYSSNVMVPPSCLAISFSRWGKAS